MHQGNVISKKRREGSKRKEYLLAVVLALAFHVVFPSVDSGTDFHLGAGLIQVTLLVKRLIVYCIIFLEWASALGPPGPFPYWCQHIFYFHQLCL